MSQPAHSAYPLHDLIAQRWSPRAFQSKPVPAEALGSLFEAARWAPSCFNAQPWRFVIATADNAEDHRRLVDCLVEANQVWASKAPVLGLSIAQSNFEFNGNPNAHARHDVGLAMGQLALQAQALGLVVHQMGGFDGGKAVESLEIPEGFEPVAAFAIGYPGDAGDLPDALAERERTPRERKALGELFFDGRFGRSRYSK
jgi:nitroreductase